MTPNEKERCRSLMMSAVDGVITPAEKEELMILFRKYPEMNQEFQEFNNLKEVMNKVALQKPKDDLWRTYWFSVYHRLERGLAWFLFAIGTGIMLAYGLLQVVLEIWGDTEIPMIIKIGIFSAILGVVVLLISVLREKLFMRKNERYKEIRR